jgi:ATP-dependent exoDNAse (exonuclease V) beta subunit
VFISALHRGVDTTTPVISLASGLSVKWRNSQSARKDNKAEENRLLYVGMTRAAERLFLTYTKTNTARGWQKLVETNIAAETFANIAIRPPARLELHEIPNARFVDPPALTGQYEEYAAPGDLELFAECPRKYLLSQQFAQGDATLIRLSQADKTVREFSDAQDRKEFILREGEHCFRCSFYKGACPAGKT